MTAVLPNNLNGPFGFNIDGFVYPQFITASRAPTSQDLYPAGTRWYNTVNGLIYETTGAGVWPESGVPQATTTVAGVTRYATPTEVNTGAGTNNATLANDVFNLVQGIVVGQVPAATETTAGIAKIATTALTQAYTDNTTIISPKHLGDGFAVPPTAGYGSTTPQPVAATTLSGTTVTFTTGGSWQSNGTAINIATNADNDAINIGTAGTRTIIIGDSTSTTNIALNVGTGALNLGTDTTAHTTTLGSTNSTSTSIINGGTGGVNVGTNAVAMTITIGNVTGATAVNVNSGSGACAWTTTNGAWSLITGTGAINVGQDAVAKTITIGNVTSTTQVVVNFGTNGLNMDGVTSSVVNLFPSLTTGAITIGGTAQTTGVITLGSSSATSTVKIASGAGASTVTIAEGTAGANTVSILNGATAATGTVNILSGAGSAGGGALHMADNGRVTAVTLANVAPAAARAVTFAGGAAAQNDVWAILGGANTAGTQSFSVFSGALNGSTSNLNLFSGIIAGGIHTLNIFNANASGGTLAINVGDAAVTTVITTKILTGAAAHVLTIGNAASGAQTWNVGTGNFSMVGGGNTINIGADAAAANTINIGGTGACIIGIANTQTAGSLSAGNSMTTGTLSLGGANQTGLITIGKSTLGQTVAINNAASNTVANVVNILAGATPGANNTLNIMTGAGTAGTQIVNILSSGATRAGQVNIGTGIAAHVVTIGQVTSSLIVNCPQTITLASGSAIGLAIDTSAGTGVGATFKSTNVTTPDIESLKGGILVTPTDVAAGMSPLTANNRHFKVVFNTVSIAASAVQALVINNSTITGASTDVMITWFGATTGSAVSLQSVVNGAGTCTLTFTNGAGATTTVSNITVIGWVMD